MNFYKTLRKRGLALFLALTMCLSLVQVTAFASDETQENAAAVTEATAADPAQESEDGAEAVEDDAEAVKDDAETAEGDAEAAEGDAEAVEGDEEAAGDDEEKAPDYATLEELRAAFEAVGEALEDGSIQDGIDAIDAYFGVYSRLSPEDQEAMAGEKAAAEDYRAKLVAILEAEENDEEYEDEDIDTLAYDAPRTVRLFFVYYDSLGGYLREYSQQTINTTKSKVDGKNVLDYLNANFSYSIPSGQEFYGYRYRDGAALGYGSWSTASSSTKFPQSTSKHDIGIALKAASSSSGSNYVWNFTLKYDANGGSGAPVDQTWGTTDKYTKSHTFAISNVTPTRSGYVFKGWAKTAGATSAAYQPNGSYLMSQTLNGYDGGSVTETLYAVWEKNTTYYAQVVYNSNTTDTVTGMPGNYLYSGAAQSPAYTLSTAIPQRSGYTFKGWSTVSGENNGGSVITQITLTTNTTSPGPSNRVYAVWEKNTPGITVTKTATKTNPAPGENVTFNIVVTNTGNVDFGQVAVVDMLPATGLEYVSASVSPDVTNPPSYVWFLQNVAAGARRTITVTAKVADNATGTLTNNVSVVGYISNTDTVTANDSATVTVTPGDPITRLGNFTVKKSFVGLAADVTRPNVTLTYEAYRTKDGTKVGQSETGTVSLSANGDILSGTINPTVWDINTSQMAASEVARYKNVVIITETTSSAAVNGYTLQSFGPVYPADGTANGDKVTFEMDGGTFQKNLSVKNTYTAKTNPAPVLKVEKSADKSVVKVGDTVTYTIKVTNTGTADATNVVVSDALPNGLTVDPDSISDGGSYGSRTITWNELGTITANGGSKTVTFTATVNASGEISNVAKAKSNEIETPVESDPEVITGVNMSIKTTKGHGTITVNEATGVATIPYTVTVTNTGDDLYGLDIIDKLTKIDVTGENGNSIDANVEIAYTDIKVGGNAVNAQMSAENGGTVEAIARNTKFAKDQTVTLTYNITVQNKSDAKVMVSLSNRATGGSWSADNSGARMFSLMTASSGGDYDVTDSASDSASIGGSNASVVIPPAKQVTINDLTITKTANETNAKVGEQVTFTITVSNSASVNATVKVTDTLPAGLEVVGNGATSWDDVVVPAGGNVTKTVTAKVTQAGALKNTAKVELGSDSKTAEATVTATVTPPVVDDGKGITIVKTRTSAATAEQGDEITWNIKVTNLSNVEKTVTLTEQTGVTLSEISFKLAAGADKTVTASYEVTGEEELDANGKFFNTVKGSTGKPGEKENPEAKDEGTRIGTPDTPVPTDWSGLTITKEADKATAKAGDDVTYTITVENKTGKDLKDVKVSEKLPDEVTLKNPVSGYANDVWTIDSLQNGQTAVLKLTVTVNTGVVDTTISNTVTITDASTDEKDPEKLPEDGQKPGDSADVTVPAEPETPEQVTVTWLNGYDGGQVGDPAQVAKGTTEIPEDLYPAAPTREGYTFAGWSDPVVGADGNITITAKWTANPETDTYAVTYSWNLPAGANASLPAGGSYAAGAEVVVDGSYTNGTQITVGGVTYVFSGWSRTGTFTMPSAAVTITGTWTVRSTTPTTPTPPTPTDPVTPPAVIPDAATPLDSGETIGDQEVPLANTVGLNDADHFAYIIGYDDDTVRPLNNITRAEAVTIFFRLMTEEYRTANWSTENSFSDVNAGDWFNNAVSTVQKAGALEHFVQDGKFLPNQAITRAEFASIAAGFVSDEITGENVGDFSDTADHWAAEAIRKAVEAGWITGKSGNTFAPDETITRAEVMTIVNRMLDRTPDKDHMLPEMKKWTDNPEDAWYYEAVQEATNEHDYERDEMAVETWTLIKEHRDWAALETKWAANNGASEPKE